MGQTTPTPEINILTNNDFRSNDVDMVTTNQNFSTLRNKVAIKLSKLPLLSDFWRKKPVFWKIEIFEIRCYVTKIHLFNSVESWKFACKKIIIWQLCMQIFSPQRFVEIWFLGTDKWVSVMTPGRLFELQGQIMFD